MSNVPDCGRTTSPWLAVDLDHRFLHTHTSFRLRMSFQLNAMRTVVFGPSGSGKSSLLRAITGLLEPDVGVIRVFGMPLWQRSPNQHSNICVPVEKRRVGLVMQNPAVFPHFTVADNVGFSLRGLERHARMEKVNNLLHLVEAETISARLPSELSGGQLQRVAIARTLASNPSILLLDEPFGALDAQSRERISENLHSWAHEHNVPVLTVTHNLEEAFTAGKEVIALEEGSIRAQGTPHEVLLAERERLLRAMSTSASSSNPREREAAPGETN